MVSKLAISLIMLENIFSSTKLHTIELSRDDELGIVKQKLLKQRYPLKEKYNKGL